MKKLLTIVLSSFLCMHSALVPVLAENEEEQGTEIETSIPQDTTAATAAEEAGSEEEDTELLQEETEPSDLEESPELPPEEEFPAEETAPEETKTEEIEVPEEPSQEAFPEETVEETEADSVTVVFEANAEETSGEMEDQIFTVNEPQYLTANAYECEGYAFLNWNTKADGSGMDYADEEAVVFETAEPAEFILYAQWEEASLAEEGEDETEPFVWKENKDGTLTLKEYNGQETFVRIPSEADGKTVTVIGKSAFKNKPVTSVILPNTVKEIQSNAFTGCSELKKIVIPESVEEIEMLAFGLSGIEGLQTAGPIGSDANIEIAFGETIGTRYSLSGLFACLKYIQITDPVKSIGAGAFAFCTSLESVDLSSSVTSIGALAFTGCKNLYHISIPASVTSIASTAFGLNGNDNLTGAGPIGSGANVEIEFTDTLTDLYQKCDLFRHLQWAELPECVTRIGSEAFKNSKKLQIINLPNALEVIESGAFKSCGSLDDLYLPETCTLVESDAFDGCTGLVSVIITSSATVFRENAFGKDGAEGLQTLGAFGSDSDIEMPFEGTISSMYTKAGLFKHLKSIDLPEGPSVIGTGAFAASIELESVRLPDSITEIEEDSFRNCIALTSIKIGRGLAKVKGNAFLRAPMTLAVIYRGSEEAWNQIDIRYGNDPLINASFTFLNPVTGITLDQTEVYTMKGNSFTLHASITPEDATIQTVHWSSSFDFVATVDENGTVTAAEDGLVTITAMTEDGHLTAVCEVNVIPDPIYIVGLEDSYPYTGSAIKPLFEVYDSGRLLKKNTDYTVSFKYNTNAASADAVKAPTIVIKGKGKYRNTKNVNFTIAKAQIADADASALTLFYTGKVLKLEPTVKFNGKSLKKDKDYEIDLNGWNQIDAGTHDIILKGKGNFEGEKTIRVYVPEDKKASVKVSSLSVKTTAVDYRDGLSLDEILTHVTVKDGKTILNRDESYTVSDPKNCDQAGTCTFTLTGIGGKYWGERTVSVKITGIALSKVKVTAGSAVYNGTARKLSDIPLVMTAKIGNETYTLKAEDYSVLENTYTKNIDAGTASVTIEGRRGFTGKKKISYKILPDTDEGTKNIEIMNAEYAKAGAVPEITITGAAGILEQGKDYKVTLKNNKAVGTGTAVIKFLGNYKGTPDTAKTFEITPKDLCFVYGVSADIAYANKKGNYKAKVTLYDTNGKKMSAGTDYDKTITWLDMSGKELDPDAILPEGSELQAKLRGIGNYTGETIVPVRIISKKADISKASFKIADQEYTGNPVFLDYDAFTKAVLNKKDLTPGWDFEILIFQNNINRGTAKVVLKGVGDCAGTKTVSFKIIGRSIPGNWKDVLFSLFGF